jgi:hypothetical protein
MPVEHGRGLLLHAEGQDSPAPAIHSDSTCSTQGQYMAAAAGGKHSPAPAVFDARSCGVQV